MESFSKSNFADRMELPDHRVLRPCARILNSGQTRSLLLTGNIHDLFCHSSGGETIYAPLLDYLVANWHSPHLSFVVYELNGAVCFPDPEIEVRVRRAWSEYHDQHGGGSDTQGLPPSGTTERDSFDFYLRQSLHNSTLALEFLRQLCACARQSVGHGRLLEAPLLIIIEGADLLVPDAPISNLNDSDRQRVTILHDWFGDPGFMNDRDAVVLLAESRSLLHQRIARLPQLLEVEVPVPDEPVRRHFIHWFDKARTTDYGVKCWGTHEDLAKFTAGLNVHALMQLLKGAVHDRRELTQRDVVDRVEAFIKGQLGEDIVEFKKPVHNLKAVVGFRRLKTFLEEELMPRLSGPAEEALSGAAVCGPIGSGKTFIFEAMAAELDMVVLVLKNVRSHWFGQTDVLFERLRRVLQSLARVLIFVDEADTQFGGVTPEVNETERRLTGRVQSMMSDTALRGHVFWLLITARIHLLSPDLRRPGRVGDLIIPMVDPEGDDRDAFIEWALKPVLAMPLTADQTRLLHQETEGYSAAAFASLRRELQVRAKRGKLVFDTVLNLLRDYLPPAIQDTRRYQTLQALINCTRRRLLPDPDVTDDTRRRWEEEIRSLEERGVR